MRPTHAVSLPPAYKPTPTFTARPVSKQRGVWRQGACGPIPARHCGALSSAGVKTILVGTTSPQVFAAVESAIGAPDREITHVESGRAICNLVKSTSPALVVLDLQIGSMGGVATAMKLRQEAQAGRTPSTPIVLLTDRADDAFIASGAQADVIHVKPVDAWKLSGDCAPYLSDQVGG